MPCIFGQHKKKMQLCASSNGNAYIYTLLEREERSIYAMSRNPRVCPAQINVWCCAAGGSYSSQCGNVVFARHCPHSRVGGT